MILLDCCQNFGVTGILARSKWVGYTGFGPNPNPANIYLQCHVEITWVYHSISIDYTRTGSLTFNELGGIIASSGDAFTICQWIREGMAPIIYDIPNVISETEATHETKYDYGVGGRDWAIVTYHGYLIAPATPTLQSVLAEAEAIAQEHFDPPPPGQFFVSPHLNTFDRYNGGEVIQGPSTNLFSQHSRRVACYQVFDGPFALTCVDIRGWWNPVGITRSKVVGAAVSRMFWRLRDTPHCIYTRTASECDKDFTNGPDGLWETSTLNVVERTCVPGACLTGEVIEAPPIGLNVGVMRFLDLGCPQTMGCQPNPAP